MSDSEKEYDDDDEMDVAGQIESKAVQDLKQQLEQIIEPIHAPDMFPPHPVKCTDPNSYPQSYNSNTKKEQLVLEYVANFKKQFQFIYPNRQKLFMSPYNECGIEKFVCTTIRPTSLKFSHVYDWSECAKFVCDYLQFVPLAKPTQFPQVLWSPTKVLSDQQGNCFDYATVLTSLLIGAGYDAYTVAGYASREVCNMDQTRSVCPLLVQAEAKQEESAKKEAGKYCVKPARDMNSKYLVAMEAKERRRVAEVVNGERLAEEERVREMERPGADPLYGMRIHSWVVVLSGKREVAETFFIEALTGCAVASSDESYLGIESVWSERNYWVNMQSCLEGCAALAFDLGDAAKWEYMLPSNDKPILHVPDLEAHEEQEERDKGEEVEKHLDLPPSWVDMIMISPKEFEKRCPLGKKVILYKKCKLEKFAPYLLKDNMVLKMSEYSDYEMKSLIKVTEQFIYRNDKIMKRIIDFASGGWVVETFARGRAKFLKEHRYQQSKTGPENERTMLFFHQSRLDGLAQREETNTEMTEHFVNRDDFLYFRKTIFDKRQKKFGPQDGDNYRPILKIIERYERSPRIPLANDDVHELTFNMEADKFSLSYHRESAKIAPSTREFAKPANWNDKGNTWTWSNDLHSTYQSGTDHKPKKNVELFQQLTQLIGREEKAKELVRKSEEEVKTILNERSHEETVTELTVSIYDTERNVKARHYKLDLERKLSEEKLRKQTLQVDYLAPFLAEQGISVSESSNGGLRGEAGAELRERCLADLKQRLIDKANLIQKRFEVESNEMQEKQQWYQKNQLNMSREDEQEYLDYCAEAMFRIHILELRLNRHKEMAPVKYQEMEHKLKSDPRFINN